MVYAIFDSVIAGIIVSVFNRFILNKIKEYCDSDISDSDDENNHDQHITAVITHH